MLQQTPLQLCQIVYQDVGLPLSLTSLTMTARPYNAAGNFLNYALADINRAGLYWFCETSQALTYTPGSYTYDLNSIATIANPIEPRRIIKLRREQANNAGKLTSLNWNRFECLYRKTTIPTTKPIAWSTYGTNLYLNCIPDQDYSLVLYFYNSIHQVIIGVNDTKPLIVPIDHLDVVADRMKAYLLKDMMRPDATLQFELSEKKIKNLVAKSNQNSSRPTQMPRAF